jgi:hypothetical protein
MWKHGWLAVKRRLRDGLPPIHPISPQTSCQQGAQMGDSGESRSPCELHSVHWLQQQRVDADRGNAGRQQAVKDMLG